MADIECSPKFRRVTVQNGYRANEWFVYWDMVDSSLLDGDIYVYRSTNSANWTRLNPDAPLHNVTYYQDSFRKERDTDGLFYRILIIKKVNGVVQFFHSPVGGLYQGLSCEEHQIAARILDMTLQSMEAGRVGQPAFLLTPKLSGDPCTHCNSARTGVAYQSSSCPYCYGTKFLGGYGNAIRPYVERKNEKVISVKDLAGSKGTVDISASVFTSLPFPVPRVNDILIIPSICERYAVSEVKVGLFQATIPIQTTVEAIPIPVGDIRWTIQTTEMPNV